MALAITILGSFCNVACAQAIPLKVLTYNIHGGHGNAEYNLELFKELLNGDEHLLCLQEIKPNIWPAVQAAFSDYPHSQIVWRETTDDLGLFESRQREGGAIFSKLPFLNQQERLIQIDPGGDLWERKAGFVNIQTGTAETDNVFIGCYHNTYNFNDNDFASEQEGMRKFREISLDEMSAESLSTHTPYILLGDFNIFADKIAQVLPDAPFSFSVGRDHIATNITFLQTVKLDTRARDISDHDAVVATLDKSVSFKPSNNQSQSSSQSSSSSEATEHENRVTGGGASSLITVLILSVFLSRHFNTNREK